MSKEFVIVIEADNKRAHAAYLTGLAGLERYAQAIDRMRRRPRRYWYTRKVDGCTLIVCRLGGEQDIDAPELAHGLDAADLRNHYDPRWLVLNAIAGLARNADRVIPKTIEVRAANPQCCGGGPQWGHAWHCPELLG